MASVPFNNLITFSRGSNATLTGSNGLIQYAPNNLALNSESFDAAIWTKFNSTVNANVTSAPDGTSTADALVENTTNGSHIVQQFINYTSGLSYTLSFYVKAGTRSWTRITMPTAAFGTEVSSFYNLSGAGSLGTASGPVTARTITAVGNGWYQVTLTGVATATAGGNTVLYSAFADNNSFYAGVNGAEALYVWGAELELGTAATTYNPTTVKNLLGFSEAFDNAVWTKARASIVTGAQANPVNGAFNAQKLMEDTSNNFHRVSQVPTLTATPYTASIYAKSAGRNWLYMANASLSQAAYFNLNTGVVGTIVGAATATITPAGNGWYRCSITSTAAAGAQNYSFYTANADASFSYTGDGSSGIYIYGAQLSDSASLDPYVPTPGAAPSSTAYYGPRFDYDPVTLQPKGILVEEARTNLALRSEEFDNAAWTKNNATVTANSIISPSGALNADTLTRGSFASEAMARQATSQAVSTTHTLSVFAKAGSAGALLYLRNVADNVVGTPLVTFALDGSNTMTPNVNFVGSSTITPFGNGWYRCTITSTTAAVISGNLIDIGCSTNAGNLTGTAGAFIYLYGAQLEAGAFATSYIPTVASTVTRSADVASITGSLFSQWYGQPEGTLVAQATIFGLNVTAASGITALSNGTSAENTAMFRAGGANNLTGEMRDGGVTQATFTIPLGSQPFKVALAYATNNTNLAQNGTAQTTDTACTVPTADRLVIGAVYSAGDFPTNGHIRSIDYYPARLANFQIQALTELSLVATLNLDFINGMYDA